MSKPLEVDRLSPYLVGLFALLSTATLFEGFDSAMFSFAAPEVRESLGISRENWGFISGITRVGVVASFLFMLSADRFGRRAVMMLTVATVSVLKAAENRVCGRAVNTIANSRSRPIVIGG